MSLDLLGEWWNSIVTWWTDPIHLEDLTAFASGFVFSIIAIALFGILVVLLVIPVRTRMQRGWRSKTIAFNLVIWRSMYLAFSDDKIIPQPWAFIFWLIVGGFMLDFILAFHETWIVGAFGRRGRWKIISGLLGILILASALTLTVALSQ
jgi:hypothetical protein